MVDSYVPWRPFGKGIISTRTRMRRERQLIRCSGDEPSFVLLATAALSVAETGFCVTLSRCSLRPSWEDLSAERPRTIGRFRLFCLQCTSADVLRTRGEPAGAEGRTVPKAPRSDKLKAGGTWARPLIPISI